MTSLNSLNSLEFVQYKKPNLAIVPQLKTCEKHRITSAVTSLLPFLREKRWTNCSNPKAERQTRFPDISTSRLQISTARFTTGDGISENRFD